MTLVPKPRPDADTVARLKALPQAPTQTTKVTAQEVVDSIKRRHGKIK